MCVEYCFGWWVDWVWTFNEVLLLDLGSLTVYFAKFWIFVYMYFSTGILYDYDDWSSYPKGWMQSWVYELHAKFQACGTNTCIEVCDTATLTGQQGFL